VAELVHASRAHADEAELLALPCFADRLEGLSARAADERDKSERLLAKAFSGFTRLEAGWEAARTALALAEVLADGGDSDRARQLLAEARPVLERLRSVRESSRAQDLAGRLS
jgi:hypothetical protein